MSLSADPAGPGQTTLLTARGFLPLHPVTLTIDRRRIATLHADRRGTISFRIDPATLDLTAGEHTIGLAGMLLTMKGTLGKGDGPRHQPADAGDRPSIATGVNRR